MGIRQRREIMKKRALFTLLMVAAVSSYASSTEVVIFSDDFSGGAATNLNGQAPDVRPGGETWVAVSSPSYFKADGSFVGGGTGGTRGGSATLAFTPEDGRVYTLDASVTGVTGDGNWIGFGFAQGQSTAGSTDARFTQGNVIGKAWMLLKGDATGSENSALMNGTASNEPWATYTQENPGGDMLMRIVLDTMGGAGNWSATWYAKRPADPDYAIILATTNLLDETISSVGFAVSGPTVSGSIESFSLIVPAGDVRGPYTADANTLHLWHMDESNPGPAAPASGVTDSFNLTPGGGAMLGNLAYAGFGAAGDASAATDAGFQGNSIPVSSVTGADGAFTFEALVRVANVTDIQQIIAMDRDGGTTVRPFQFRIDADTAAGSPATGALRFINIAGPSGVQTIIAPIPTAGDHAFVANEWFHVAATYNGAENTADNFKLYWTRMDISPTPAQQANEIMSTNMTDDLAGSNSILGVGNEYKGTSDNNIKGRIDEVRISDIARAADEMMFGLAPPQGTMVIIR